ncbi:MAG: 3-hydroxyacyl-CoA dehydrogenase NAD-binding domain-containing protein [Paracoccaceae bacterium]
MSDGVTDHLDEILPELGPSRDAPRDGPWRLARDEAGVAWLALDRGEGSANAIGRDALEGLDAVLEGLEADPPKALAIRSAKPAGFAVGADVEELKALEGEAEVERLLEEGLSVLDRLEAQTFPTVAVIHGHCLGAGLELALACDRRIFVGNAHAAFPEVKLGLHPGLCGTVRLPAVIDPLEAMTMMLTGKPAYADKAEALGLADAVVEERHVRAAVGAVAAGRLEGPERGMADRLKTLGPARRLAAGRMRRKTEEKAPKAHYPAPHALIDLWEAEGDDPEGMRRGETRSFAALLRTDACRALMRVFELREGLKGAAKGDHGISRVHVVGAGEMGADIAAWCALKGCRVSLSDVSKDALGAAVPRAEAIFRGAHLDDRETRAALDRLIPDPAGHGAVRADLVIEAAPEDLELKRGIYAELEPRLKTEALIATNTSSLRLAALAEGLQAPGRFGGLHFFNPVAKMELVETVRHDGTDPETARRLDAFAAALGRLPVPVADAPGFVVNRALTPYLLETLALLDEGVEKASLDAAAEAFGMPMGPVELADQVGLDICLGVAESLARDLDRPLQEIPNWFRERVEAGDLGRKTGRGLYDWEDGEAKKDAPRAEVPEDLTDRLVLPMLDACVECLRRGVVRDAGAIDAAMIFGTGFAPFRGGPLAYAEARGAEEIRATLERLAERHGPRFRPDPGWSDLG